MTTPRDGGFEISESGFQRHGRRLARLAQSRHLGKADVGPFLGEVTETASETLGVERVSVWLYENEKRAIRCLDLFERAASAHSSGAELLASNFPTYFESLRTQRAIAADDARTDERTAEFTESYLTPLGITSMLDAPIRAGEDMLGVVCLEHVGPARVWSREEQSFAASLADIVALGFETAERRRAWDKARLSEERYRTLAANFPNGAVLLYDRDLRYIVADGIGLADVGLSREGLEGRTIWEALPPEASAHIEPYYRGALAGERGVWEMEFGGKTFRVHAEPVRDGEGTIVAGMVMTQDVTETRKAQRVLEEYSHTLEAQVAARTRELREKQAQLVQSAKMASLGGLVAGIVHEINNPLGAMTGSNDVVRRSAARIREVLAGDGAIGDDERRRIADLVDRIEDADRTGREAGRRISTIVSSLKEFARLDQSAEAVVDLHDGIESTLALVGHLLGERITVRRDYGEVPRVRCFPDKVNQATMNLLLNAVQAIPGRGEITVRTRASKGTIDVEVSDTGVGIPGENMERIFDPGFTTKGVKVGTGLGLSIVHRIMEEHGGSVEVDSTTGSGSTFRLRLPIERAVPRAAG